MTSIYFQTFASAASSNSISLCPIVLLLKEFHMLKLCFLKHCDLCCISRKLLLKKLHTSHSDTCLFQLQLHLLEISKQVQVSRRHGVYSKITLQWCSFLPYPRYCHITFSPTHIWEDFLTNPNISSICHFWSATSLAVATSLWYLRQS